MNQIRTMIEDEFDPENNGAAFVDDKFLKHLEDTIERALEMMKPIMY
jgi:hypothetical protein